MGIYNLNPRRVVWFSPNEPSNKYDIWLSRNAHLDENGEPTTDSNSQRDCDYIFKIYDCGKWNPIVGFNSTAANKIDTVTGADYTIDGVTHSGKEVYHPAIFTAESPNELYDAGTLGSLLSNPNFVSELEWYYLFNSTNYSWDNIFGDTNWFGDLIWETIQGGSSTYHLPFATTERCGGILSDTHTYNAASAFKPIEVKFYPTTNMYSQKLHRLCVSASDVIEQINSYYNDNPSGYSLNIPLANTLHIGGIKAAQDPNTADDCRNIPIVLAGPTVGSVWGLPFGSGTYPGDTDNETEYLYLPGWALLEWMKNPYFNQQEPQPFVSGWKGVDTQLRENSDLIWIGLSGVTPENTGKFCTVQLDDTDPSGATIEWVDVQGGVEYEELGPSNTNQNLYVVRGLDDSQKQRYLLGGNGKWTRVGYGISTMYNAGNDEIHLVLHIHKLLDATIDSLTTPSIIFNITITPQGDEIVTASYDNTSCIINQYQYKVINISTAATLYFNNISNNEHTNPIRIKIVTSNNLDLSFTNTKYICEGDNPLTVLPKDTEWLLTFQFGVVKFEKIITPTSQS